MRVPATVVWYGTETRFCSSEVAGADPLAFKRGPDRCQRPVDTIVDRLGARPPDSSGHLGGGDPFDDEQLDRKPDVRGLCRERGNKAPYGVGGLRSVGMRRRGLDRRPIDRYWADRGMLRARRTR